MSDYRRYFVAGATYFFTIVTHHRRPVFTTDTNIALLRHAIATVKREQPFEINAAVVLQDHLHFLWTLPPGDDGFSKRIGRIKVEFTKAFRSASPSTQSETSSRQRRCERDVWQRRFWEHLIRDDEDFDRHFDYIHCNPVKHGLGTCPHAWVATSFHHWTDRGVYDRVWGCNCGGHRSGALDFSDIAKTVGE
jgi:putative transposase